MMFDALGYPEDHPDRSIARASIDKLVVLGDERSLLPALRFAGVGHRPCLPRAARSRRRRRARERSARPAVAAAAAGARGQRRLGDAAAGRAAGRLGVPVQQRPLSRSRRHRRGGDGDGPARRRRPTSEIRHRDRPRRANGSKACRPRTAAGAPSTPTTPTTISTTFRSPITARCSIRRPRTSRRDACRCSPSSASAGEENRACPRRSTIYCETQLADGSWYGRWGMNYIYGAWSVLCALNAAGLDGTAMTVRRAADWLVRDPESRRRLGRGRHELQARISRLRAGAEHGVADRLGAARADGGGTDE